MHIVRIAISNFRNFSSIDVGELPAGLVVVGENASGKTNLVEALRLVLDPSLPESARRLVADDFWDGLDQPFGGHEIKVVVELAGFDSDKVAKAVLGEFLIGTNPHRARLTYRYRPMTPELGSDATETDYEVVIFGGDGDESRRVGRWERRFVSLHILPALRDAETDLRSARSPLRRLVDRSKVDPETLSGVVTQIDAATGLLTDSSELSSVASSISDRLSEMAGGLLSGEAFLGFLAAKPDQFLRSLRLFVDRERRRGVEQSSLGTANLLYLTLLLEDIEAQRAGNEMADLILAVEEPEAHLHPHVQRVLFQYLLRTDQGLIVTTHSPHIASVTPVSSLLVLRKSGGASTAHHAATDLFTKPGLADIERYLDVTRGEILFARAVVLVEGLAELYLIPAFAKCAGLNLDASGISVCSVHGTDFKPYVRLLGARGLGIPAIVVTDGDRDENGRVRGIERCARLMDGDDGETVEEAVATGNYEQARALCWEAGYFIGEQSLEADLIASAGNAMVAAYDELVESDEKKKKFRTELADAESDATQRAKVLGRIERVGKGRFAQRLAGHLQEVEPPTYIALALARIKELVDSSQSVTRD